MGVLKMKKVLAVFLAAAVLSLPVGQIWAETAEDASSAAHGAQNDALQEGQATTDREINAAGTDEPPAENGIQEADDSGQPLSQADNTITENPVLTPSMTAPPDSVETNVSSFGLDEEEQSAAQTDGLPDASPPETQPKHISFDIEFTGGADCAVIGDTLWTEITFRNYGDDFTATGRWLLNGSPVPGFSNEQFTVYNGKTSAYPKYISKDFWDWGEITIGFEILIGGETFYRTERKAEIWNVPYSKAKINSVLAKVTPVRVEAWLNKTADLYSDVNCKYKKGTVKSGTKAICLNSKTGFSNQISLPDGRTGWVHVGDLNVSQKNYTQSPDLSNWDKNIFVNAKGYASSTDYLIWINLAHQRVNVFKGSKGEWSIEGVFPCASGRNVTPTITGVFKYYEKQSKWPYPNYYVAPVMIFSGNYAMHSVLLSNNGGIYDGTLGRPASNGCVRLSKQHIDWLAENIPLGTTVVVY